MVRRRVSPCIGGTSSIGHFGCPPRVASIGIFKLNGPFDTCRSFEVIENHFDWLRWNKALHGRMRGTLKKHRIKNLSMDRLLSSRALVVCLFSKPLYVSKTLQLVSTGISVKEFLEKT